MKRKVLIIANVCLVVVLSAYFFIVFKKYKRPVTYHTSGAFPKPSELGFKPNILLLVMDTTRHDHLSCYGYPRSTTPNLDKLCRTSTLFQSAYSTSCWTIPSHASLFTGLMPVAHQTTQEHVILDQVHTTLAEILSTLGYKTSAIIGNPMLDKKFQFDQGFDTYLETWRLRENEFDDVNVELFNKCLDSSTNKPFFIFVNFIEPHAPYDSSMQFKMTFVKNRGNKNVHNHRMEYYLDEVSFIPEDFIHLKSLYDAEILYTDHIIGLFIKELKHRQLFDNTIIIVTSDHGEHFGEHGLVGHIFSLHEALVRIPLLIHFPKLFAQDFIDNRKVQLQDIFTTLTKIACSNEEDYPQHGRSLFPGSWSDERPIITEFAYPEQELGCFGGEKYYHKLDPYRRALRSYEKDEMKFIWASDDCYMLYDLRNDPLELKNLSHEKGALLQAWNEKLQQRLKKLKILTVCSKDSSNVDLDHETIEALKTLGYMR